MELKNGLVFQMVYKKNIRFIAGPGNSVGKGGIITQTLKFLKIIGLNKKKK